MDQKIFYLVLICIIMYANGDCPAKETIIPCACKFIKVKYAYICMNSTTFPSIKGAITKAMTGAGAVYLSYYTFNGDTIPGGFFKGVNADVLSIYNSVISKISKDAFTGLENVLNEFMIRQSNLTRIPGEAFTNMKAITDIAIMGSLLASVKKADIDLLPATLDYLTLNKNKISSIEPKAFVKLTSLDGLFLTHNQLASMPADALPTRVAYLYLNENKFTSIPVNALKNMPMESQVTLMKNLITGLPSEKDLTPILRNKININLYGNKIICGCDTKWIADLKKDEPSMMTLKGPCVSGSGNRSYEYIQNLTPDKYSDCPQF